MEGHLVERQQEVMVERSQQEAVGKIVEEQRLLSAQNPHSKHSEIPIEDLPWDWKSVSSQAAAEPLLLIAYPSNPEHLFAPVRDVNKNQMSR